MTAYTQVAEGKQEKEFSDFIEQLLFRRCYLVQLCTGSSVELPAIYSFENVTDVDTIRYRRNICAVKTDMKTPKDFKGTVLIIQSEGSHHGYARLYFKSNNVPYTYAMLPEDRPAKLQVLFQKSEISNGLLPDSSYTSKWLANFQGLSHDLVEAIWCPNWPEEAHEWTIRERFNDWPLFSTVNRIVNNGCFLVVKPHQGSQMIANEWRFSFSEAELLLIHSWNDVQIHIYHILLLIKSDVVRKCGGKKMTFLTTYHFKTLMFWACEEKPKEFWLPDNIKASVKQLICDMIGWLIEKQCRNYFMPGNDMLDHLPDSHDFQSEVHFLTDSINLVDQYISNTVALTMNSKYNRCNGFSVRISTNVILAMQLRASFWDIIDPSRPGRHIYKYINALRKNHLFRSDILNLFRCLKIHRRLILAKDMEEKFKLLHEGEESFKRAYEKQADGFTHVNISPMDNLHVIMAKLLTKSSDSSDRIASPNNQQVKSILMHRNDTRWELCYSRTERLQRNHITRFLEMVSKVMNGEMVKPTCLQSAAYEANFYWTIFADEENDIAKKSYKMALDICDKWLFYFKTIQTRVTFKVCFGMHGLPVIISNRWSRIFDKYIQVVLGFLSLVKAITTRRFRSINKLSDTYKDFDVLVHVHAIDLLA